MKARPAARAVAAPGGRPDFASMSPEQLERAKEMMRSRGMTDEQIEERIGGDRKQAETE